MPAKKKKVIKRKKPIKKKIIKQRPAVKKKIVKKAKKKAALKKPKAPVLGVVTHYFPHVSAAVVKVKIPFAVGDNIKVKGHTTDFTQAVQSMQIDRVPIQTAKKGQEIGLMVNLRVRQHDKIYKA